MPLEPIGSTFGTARNISLNTTSQSFTDNVNSLAPNDYYCFATSGRSTLNLSLTGLSANADLQILQDLNGNGRLDPREMRESGNRSGTLSELLNVPLSAGNYLIRVYTGDPTANTKYTLNASISSIGNPDYVDPLFAKSYFGTNVTRSFYNASGISNYQSQYGDFLMYGGIAKYYSDNYFKNPDSTNGLFGIYSGLGVPTSSIYKQSDGTLAMDFEGGKLTANAMGVVMHP